MLNAVLVPIFSDFFDFATEFAGSSNFSLAKLLHVRHASGSGERKRIDVRIRHPEIVVPESVDAAVDDAQLLVARWTDIAIQNDFSPDVETSGGGGVLGASVDKFAFSAVDQALFTCQRSDFLKSSAALDALATAETLLSPLTIAATVRWAPEQVGATASRLSVQCRSDAVRVRLSSRAAKSLVVIAAHVGEAMVPQRTRSGPRPFPGTVSSLFPCFASEKVPVLRLGPNTASPGWSSAP